MTRGFNKVKKEEMKRREDIMKNREEKLRVKLIKKLSAPTPGSR